MHKVSVDLNNYDNVKISVRRTICPFDKVNLYAISFVEKDTIYNNYLDLWLNQDQLDLLLMTLKGGIENETN